MLVLDAIAKGDVNALKSALDGGADADHVDGAGVPVLLHAADTGNVELVDALLAAGADLEARDNIGWTVLMGAIAGGDVAMVDRVLAAGANTNHVALEDTPLTCAVSDASHQVIQRLLLHGADPDLRRPDGWTPLMLAAFRGEILCVRALLERGADATITVGPRLMDASTIAAANGHAQAAQLLYEAAEAAHPDPSELWSAILAWCELKAPALVGRMTRAESTADGPEEWGALPIEVQLQLGQWAPGLPFYDYRGLDLPGSVAVWTELWEQVEAGAFIGRTASLLGEDEPILRQYWCGGWVPIAQDEEGNLLLVDLEPRPNGLRGQFISWSIADGPLSVLASSITPWLRQFVSEVRRNKVAYEPRSDSLIQKG